MKISKRPASSLFLSHKNKNIEIRNNLEESKNGYKEINRNIFDNNINNKKYILLDKNIQNDTSKNNFHLNYYYKTDLNNNLNLAEFFGEISNRNKLNWSLISERNKEKGKILWKKLSRVEPKATKPLFKNENQKESSSYNYNILNNYLKGKRMQNNKSYISRNSEEKYYDLERINSAIFGENRRDLKNGRLNEETDEESDDIEEIEIKGQNIISENTKRKKRESQKRSSIQKNEKLEKIKKLKNEKSFDSKIKNNRIDKSKIFLEYKEVKEKEEINKNKKKLKKRGKNKLYLNKYKSNDMYKINKKEKKIIKIGNGNIIKKKDMKSKKTILSLIKGNKNNSIKNKNKDLMCRKNSENIKKKRKNTIKINKNNYSNNHKIKNKYISEKKLNTNQKDKEKEGNNNKNEDDILLNSSDFLPKKCQSLILDSCKVYDNFSQAIISENKKQNLSVENNGKNEEIIIKKIRKKIIKLSINKEEESPEILFSKLIKKSKGYYRDDEEMNKYYDEIFSKYGKDPDDELIQVKIFGINLLIKKKTQKKFYIKFMNAIRLQNKKKKESSLLNRRLSAILDKFNPNIKDINNSNDSFEAIENKNNIIHHINKDNILYNKKNSHEQIIFPSKGENEYEKDFIFEGKIDSMKEVKLKKEEVLLRIKHDIKYKIKEGVLNLSEMEHF